MRLDSEAAVRKAVRKEVAAAPVLDMHTHLFEPRFGKLLLWGIDELVTYHYLVAEFFRARPDFAPKSFWKLAKRKQADLIWEELFVKRTPVSEACRGVLTCLAALGVKPGPKALAKARSRFGKKKLSGYQDEVFRLAGVSQAVMTNNPFDDAERAVWLKSGGRRDRRFIPALRIDAILCDYARTAEKLRGMGYMVGRVGRPGARCLKEIRRFLSDWAGRMKPIYMAASLPFDFEYPSEDACGRVLTEAVLPFADKSKIPFAAMIGVDRQVNPELRLAGDGVGPTSVGTIEALCRDWPGVRFLVTLLARENQHALCVAARKFGNMMPFGCWWFLNNPSIIEEMTAQRLELLGLSFVPQHSDARVLDQLIYKWRHSREVIGKVLAEKYADTFRAGWPVTSEAVKSDVERLFSRNFLDFVKG